MKKAKNILVLILLHIFPAIIASDKPQMVINHNGRQHKAIARKEVFQHVTGMTEEDFVGHLDNNKGDLPNLPISTQQAMDQISHSTFPIKKLIKLSLPNSGGTLSIIKVDIIKHPELRHLVDIGALQAENPDSVFQIASRPNGLEGHQKQYQPEGKDFLVAENGFQSIIGKYAVQGEEAQISCPILGIRKVYKEKEQVNFLEKLGLRINEIGNIIGCNNKTLIHGKTAEELSNQIKVDCWTNVPVTTGYANVLYQSNNIKKEQKFNAKAREKNTKDANILLDNPHTITHVNVTAIDLDQTRDSMKNLTDIFGKDSPAITNLAKAALRTAYFATIYCAVIENKEKVFLTLPGCGSFKNKLEWIAEIIEELHKKNIIEKSGLTITLVALEANGNLEKDQAWNRIEDIATKSGGSRTYNGALQKSKSSPKVDQSVTKMQFKKAQKNLQPSWWQRYRALLGLAGFTFIGCIAYYLKFHHATNV